jgi:SAM-dependent methyltransferase
MIDNFYRAFEEKYRGSRELILSRLAIYRPFISPLKMINSAAPAIDLGCGRGEWLELLQNEGFSPLGIDQDEGMLQGCREHGLSAKQGDAVAYLTTLPNESQTIVSAFHVVEHISFDQLRAVVSEALRVLKPGGLLIMETPNPENIVVATRNFYLDPTHQRPIPPQLLSFLPEYYGFARTKILRLQESKDLAINESPALDDVLAGASPDYAVIAQKAAHNEAFSLFDQAFNQEYGLTLDTLAKRYDASIEARATQAEARATQAEARATQAEARATQAEARATQAEARATQAEARATQAEARATQAEARATQAEACATQAEATITALLNSTSWRITAPVRWIGTWTRKLPGVHRARAMLNDPVGHAIRYVARRPALKRFALPFLKPFPNLECRLREKRATQIRSDFLNLNTNRTYRAVHPQDAEDVLSRISATPTQLTTDEILVRIRREMNDVQVEK